MYDIDRQGEKTEDILFFILFNLSFVNSQHS